MRKVNSFDDYLFDKIFEAAVAKETVIYLSPRLIDLLDKIDHPIATDLLNFGRETVLGNKVTLLDYDDDDVSKFTYTVPSKLIELVEKNPDLDYYGDKLTTRHNIRSLSSEYPIVWTKFRNPSSIGKVINKLFPDKYKPNGVPGKDIESFTNDVKAERMRSEAEFDRFQIVDGDDIIKYYNKSSYDSNAFGGSSLGSSCMSYSSCGEFIRFYAENKGAKLVILMSEDEYGGEDKIVGRAVLWDIAYIDDEKVDRKFMDRIYSITDTDMRLFKEFAKRNGWLHKETQNMYNDAKIVDTKDGSVEFKKLKTVRTFYETGSYPYMDTMKYFHIEEGFLTNDDDHDGDTVYFLEDTSGGYEGSSGIYVEFYGERIDEDDLIWCELGEDWRYPDDAVWIENEGGYATERYAENHYAWSDLEDSYIDNDDATYSEYHDTYILAEDSVDVIKAGAADVETFEEVDTDDTDPRSNNELGSSCLEYVHDDDTYYFDNEDEDNFEEVESLKLGYGVMAHKVWDADKIFRHNGGKYLDDAGPEAKDELIGQKRLEF